MNSFEDRERAMETLFVHDQDLAFRARARATRMLGVWAAQRLAAPDPQAYAQAVIAADFDEPGDEDVLRKLLADFQAAGIAASRAELRLKMTEFMELAVTQIRSS
jgi:hypothetical protein